MEPVSSPSILPVSYDGCSEQTKECIKVPLNELRFLLTLMNPEPDILWKTARNQLWDVWIWLEYEDMTRIIMGFSGFYPSANDLCNLLTDHFKLSATVVCHHPTTRSLDGSELLEASNHYIVKGFAKNWEIECQNFVYYYNRPLSINPYPNISRGDGRYYIVHPKVARAAYLVHAFGWKDEEVYQSSDNSVSLDSAQADRLQNYQLFFQRPSATMFDEIDDRKTQFTRHHIKLALWIHCIGDPGPYLDEDDDAMDTEEDGAIARQF